MNRDAPVLVIGGAGVDIVGRLKADLNIGTSNQAQIRQSFGGVARNVAENLALLGQTVRLISAVGDDSSGEQLVEKLSMSGVDTEHVLRVAGRSTGTYLGVVNQKGVLQFALDDMSLSAALTPEYIKSLHEQIKEAALIFLDASLPKDTLRTIFSQARRTQIPVCADPASASLAHRLIPYLSQLFLVAPNDKEASILCDRIVDASKRRQAMEAAKCLVNQGVKIAIITLAQFGVCYATAETSGYIPAISTEIIDPTGGGDALSAAVIFALLNGIPLDDAIRLGVSAATLTLRFPGAVLPDLSLERLYDQLVI